MSRKASVLDFARRPGGQNTIEERERKLRELELRAAAEGEAVPGQSVTQQTSSADVPMSTQTPEVGGQTSDADVPRMKKAIVNRRGGRRRRRRTVYLPLDSDARLEEFCRVQGREVSETVAIAVELYLASRTA